LTEKVLWMLVKRGPGVNIIKLFGINLLTHFCKLDHFITMPQHC
jgi:hypothetical protein